MDDNAANLSRIHDLLSKSGLEFDLECATTHIAALNAFARNSHDVAIIDSPFGNAVSILREASTLDCSVPMIVLTSDSGREVSDAMRNNAADCIVRSYLSPTVLERAICLVVERAGLRELQNQNEQRYLGLIENASDIIYTHDLEGNYTSVNQAVSKLTGYSIEEALKLNVSQVVAPEEIEQARGMLRRKVEEQNQTCYRTEIVTKDGRRVPIEVSTHLIYRHGRPVAVQGIARDTTSRLEAESALKDSEERYRELFENANDIVYTHDLKGNFTSLNRTGERITGYSREEASRMNISQVVAPEHVDAVLKRMASKITPNDFTLYQLDLIAKDGHRVSLEVNTRLIFKDGKPFAVQGIARDVTDRKIADEALRASEQLYRQIINEANDVICRINMRGRFTLVNPVAARLLRYSEEELIGTDVLDLVRPDYRTTIQRVYKEQVKQRIPTTYFEFPAVARDGTEIWVAQNLQLIYEGGKIVGMQAVARDISDRKAMEESLRKSEERYRAFVEHSSEAIWCVEFSVPCPTDLTAEEQIEHLYQHGYLAQCNNVLAQMYGLSRASDIVGTPMSKLLPRSNKQNLRYLKAFIHSKYRLSDAESFETDRDGSSRWYLNNLVGVVENGALVRAWGTQKDISETKRAAQEVEEANRRALEDYDRLVERIAKLGQTLGQARDLTSILRAVRNFAVVSVPCDGMMISLYEPDKETRRAVYCWTDGAEVDPGAVDNIPVKDGMTGRAIKTGSIVIDNEFHKTTGKVATVGKVDDEEFIPKSALSAPMAVMGRVVGCIEIQCYDEGAYSQEHVTAMRMAANLAANAVENVGLIQREREKAEQLRQSQKMEAVGQLAGGVAHDFNNLLTAITGYSDLSLRKIETNHPLRRNLEEIKKAGTRAASLTRQLLAFSRKQMLQAEVLDLNSVVDDMDKMLRRLIGEDIDLVTLLDPAIHPIKADPGQIEQTLMNLAVNARDAMPTGGKLTIETGQKYLDKTYAKNHVAVNPGMYIMLAVSDNGTGMDEETKRRIFEPFFTTKEIGKGTGLGLSTVYGIVKQTGGNIWVYSELGKGTTFKVYLPVAEEVVSATDMKPASPEIPQGRETILLVEDEEMVRTLTCEVLQTCGYRVLSAANGEEACEISSNFEGDIDLIITDVVMPQMGGRDLAERLAATRPNTSVLYMSGYTDDAIVRHGVLDKNMPFLQKPFSPDSLARKVKEVLDDVNTPAVA
ncbi:MAG TPA: PAS domain S-box protein [Pyrinomonadaceae bacterium]